jgi:hypothetical protein
MIPNLKIQPLRRTKNVIHYISSIIISWIRPNSMLYEEFMFTYRYVFHFHFHMTKA